MRAADPAFAPCEARIDDKALKQCNKTASRFWLVAGRAFQICEACL